MQAESLLSVTPAAIIPNQQYGQTLGMVAMGLGVSLLAIYEHDREQWKELEAIRCKKAKLKGGIDQEYRDVNGRESNLKTIKNIQQLDWFCYGCLGTCRGEKGDETLTVYT